MTTEEALANKNRIQKECRIAWENNYQVGTACLATGVGKTKLAIDCIEVVRHEYLQNDIGEPNILIATPTEEMRDHSWPAEFTKWNASLSRIKFLCYASLAKEDLEQYDLLIYDECHRLTLPNLVKLSKVRKACLGLTATFPKIRHEEDRTRVELLHQLLPPIYTVTTDEAVDLGLISDFEIFVLNFSLNDTDKIIPPQGKDTTLRTELEHYKKLSGQLQKAMILGKKGEKMKFVAMSKRTQFLYNLPSKLKLAKHVLKALHIDDRRTVVFAGSIEQAEALCGKYVYHSGTDRKYFSAFQKGEINLIGAVRIINEGENLNSPDQALIVQINSTDRELVQRIGRIIRKRYHDLSFKAKIVILIARDTVDAKWYKSAIQDFETTRIKQYNVEN